MKAMPFTEEIARAAAHDAGDRNMRQHGRATWNDEDWDVAAERYAVLVVHAWRTEARGRRSSH